MGILIQPTCRHHLLLLNTEGPHPHTATDTLDHHPYTELAMEHLPTDPHTEPDTEELDTELELDTATATEAQLDMEAHTEDMEAHTEDTEAHMEDTEPDVAQLATAT